MNCKQGVRNKNEIEMALNDLPLEQLPEALKTPFSGIRIRSKYGRPHQKWGSMLRRYHSKVFMDYYDSITG